ncbi:MAG: 4-phosphoerythronate dehydrogenase [Muribaculaceae bacterium]|nr:4-phosphoerythronate dehydrogenase [Muribaculaceae bacterium]
MKILIESHIPFIHDIFEPYAQVDYLPPEAFTPQAVRDIDAMIIRTRTRCDKRLLDSSSCRIIATATIGTDHIDMDYCRERGIAVANAPGCNAPAVAQYVLSSLYRFKPSTLGIVGVGHVGKIVAAWASKLGIRVLLNDPLRELAEGPDAFCSLDRIAAEADAITFHTPLTDKGEFPTYHMADSRFFAKLSKQPVIVNAARGPVVDTEALIQALRNGNVSNAVIDCWEGEPAISSHLLGMAAIATPHIAGYSIEGKKRATAAAVKAVASHLDIPVLIPHIDDGSSADSITWHSITSSYDPTADTIALRANSLLFETLRNNYTLRHEPNSGLTHPMNS